MEILAEETVFLCLKAPTESDVLCVYRDRGHLRFHTPAYQIPTFFAMPSSVEEEELIYLVALEKQNKRWYSALRKYSAPLNWSASCHISGFKHKDIKFKFFGKNQQQVGHNREVE
ncbi:hypothetical protein CHARACLAT_003131 [Characodon lateralis]|uniref:Uncharacterized protein n=1 Tax=Characodon lateralis TaxID=208331 RepID=A0ABU7DX87_9TELE|nr:hypothetical protein [Characodon lateralis]